jgi:hypothetical protein
MISWCYQYWFYTMTHKSYFTVSALTPIDLTFQGQCFDQICAYTYHSNNLLPFKPQLQEDYKWTNPWYRTQTSERRSVLSKCGKGFHGTCVNVICTATTTKARLSVRQYLRNSQIHDSTTCRYLKLNITEIWQWMCQIWLESFAIFRGVDCHGNQNNSTNCSGHLLYQIVYKSGEEDDDRETLILWPSVKPRTAPICRKVH